MNALTLLAVLVSAAEPSSQDVTVPGPPPFVTPDNADVSVASNDVKSPNRTSSENQVQKSESEETTKAKQFGALLDVGAPDGVGISVVYSPWYFIRAHAGVMSVIYATGIRVGVTLTPFNYGFNPTLSADYGHFFQSNWTSLLSSSADPFAKSVAASVSADYFNLHLGLEFGRPQKFQFYVRGGISWVSATPDNFSQAFRQNVNNRNLEAQNPTVHLVFPSVKLGAVYFFL